MYEEINELLDAFIKYIKAEISSDYEFHDSNVYIDDFKSFSGSEYFPEDDKERCRRNMYFLRRLIEESSMKFVPGKINLDDLLEEAHTEELAHLMTEKIRKAKILVANDYKLEINRGPSLWTLYQNDEVISMDPTVRELVDIAHPNVWKIEEWKDRYRLYNSKGELVNSFGSLDMATSAARNISKMQKDKIYFINDSEKRLALSAYRNGYVLTPTTLKTKKVTISDIDIQIQSSDDSCKLYTPDMYLIEFLSEYGEYNVRKGNLTGLEPIADLKVEVMNSEDCIEKEVLLKLFKELEDRGFVSIDFVQYEKE